MDLRLQRQQRQQQQVLSSMSVNQRQTKTVLFFLCDIAGTKQYYYYDVLLYYYSSPKKQGRVSGALRHAFVGIHRKRESVVSLLEFVLRRTVQYSTRLKKRQQDKGRHRILYDDTSKRAHASKSLLKTRDEKLARKLLDRY
jgi:hypothetical protein